MPTTRDSMWFGNRNYMQWVIPPAINYDASRQAKFYNAQYTNGGAFVRQSATGARHYNLSWALKRRDDIRAIMDYADGVYGFDMPIYFIDNFAADKNLLPQYWAVPALAAKDAPQLVGLNDDERPTLVATNANLLGLPSYSAQYSLVSGSARASLYLPIPPGHTLWLGAYGTSNGGNVTVTRATGPTTTGSSTNLTLLAVTDPARFNIGIDGTQYPGAFLGITGTSGSITLSGLMAQVLPNGQSPDTGDFASGQGHSGCSFSENPVLTQYSVGLDRVGLSVDLVETEGWR